MSFRIINLRRLLGQHDKSMHRNHTVGIRNWDLGVAHRGVAAEPVNRSSGASRSCNVWMAREVLRH